MTKPDLDSNMPPSARDRGEFTQKEWLRPSLRKLSIAATAMTTRVHISFDDGNTKKVGTAGTFS